MVLLDKCPNCPNINLYQGWEPIKAQQTAISVEFGYCDECGWDRMRDGIEPKKTSE